jgi:hypothetical protein
MKGLFNMPHLGCTFAAFPLGKLCKNNSQLTEKSVRFIPGGKAKNRKFEFIRVIS